MKKRLFITAICTISISIYIIAYRSSNQFRSSQLELASLPSLKFKLLDSVSQFDTKNIKNGKASLFVYFDPDCEFCQQQIKSILKNIMELRNTSIYLITPASLSGLRHFYNQYNLGSYSDITVAQDFLYNFYRTFKVSSFPNIVIYNQNKMLVTLYQGEVPIKMITASLKSKP